MKRIGKWLTGAIVCLSFANLAACTTGNGEINWEEKGKPIELTIRSYPQKLNYVQGEIFDDDGLILDAIYEDGSVQEGVPYKVKSVDPLKVGEQQIRIVYNGAHTNIDVIVDYKGNVEEYSVANTQTIDSPLSGKKIFWLGSSVTYGEGGCGESMADFIAKRDGVDTIKEAVSGTTLRVKGDGTSYVERLNAYFDSHAIEHLDAFVCQLSTNDMYYPDKFGEISPDEVRDLSLLQSETTYGAIETIIATVRAKFDCPILFYTNQNIEKENYGDMVDALHKIADKWEIEVLDLFHDEAINDLSDEEKVLYLKDTIHPTRAGYREWWTPVFEKKLIEIVK